MKICAVTGGAGFVGRHLVSALGRRGDQVRVLDLPSASPFIAEGSEGVDYRQVDITKAAEVRAALEGVDSVFHNASVVNTSQNCERLVWDVNRNGTQHVIDGCKAAGVSRLVYVSSGSVVYAGQDIENGDETLPYAGASQAPYADSKIEAEKLTLDANGEDGLLTCALRPHVVFGPGDGRFMPAVLERATAGRLKFQVGRGTWLSDYTYVSNLIEALLLAEERLTPGSPVGGAAYFITNGEPVPFWDFVKQVLERLDLPPIRYRVPHQLVYGIAALKEQLDAVRGGAPPSESGLTRFAIRYMCTHHYFNIAKARRDLGYTPRVSMRQGIDETCAHLKATGAV